MKAGSDAQTDTAARLRADKWLFYARLLKSRALAASVIQAGAVRINGRKIDAAHAPVRIGDVLTMAFGKQVRVLRVLALGTRRGPPAEARLLYQWLEPGGGNPPEA